MKLRKLVTVFSSDRSRRSLTSCDLSLLFQVHESGFGVQEEGTAAAQRVLLSDVPGPAVLAVLRYLYTARCSVAASLRPHVLELASRSAFHAPETTNCGVFSLDLV